MKVIVVRQPWAWLIVNGYKDIENRTWATKYRGPLLIQASATRPTRPVLEEQRRYAAKCGVKLPDEFHFGGIVGCVRLEDCVTKTRSKWFDGDVGWVLSKPKKLRFTACNGRLGLFEAPPTLLRRLVLKA